MVVVVERHGLADTRARSSPQTPAVWNAPRILIHIYSSHLVSASQIEKTTPATAYVFLKFLVHKLHEP